MGALRYFQVQSSDLRMFSEFSCEQSDVRTSRASGIVDLQAIVLKLLALSCSNWFDMSQF